MVATGFFPLFAQFLNKVFGFFDAGFLAFFAHLHISFIGFDGVLLFAFLTVGVSQIIVNAGMIRAKFLGYKQ